MFFSFFLFLCQLHCGFQRNLNFGTNFVFKKTTKKTFPTLKQTVKVEISLEIACTSLQSGIYLNMHELKQQTIFNLRGNVRWRK